VKITIKPRADLTVQDVLKWLTSLSNKRTLDGMARYAVPADKALGVSMSNMKVLAKKLGHNHVLAEALWQTDVYEARMLATLIDDPALVTAAQMDRWCRDFDNWAICDTACFALFDRTPHAWKKVKQWSGKSDEFIKRAAFALLWGLTVHDKEAADKLFIDGLRLVERAARDDRNFVKKAVNMALRAIGKRNAVLNAAAISVARRLAASSVATPQWVGKHALRELISPSVTRRLESKSRSASRNKRLAANK
jgi:3-methyladenine DNA glycosylase AlkD